MKRYLLSFLASMLLSGIPLVAQSVPEIRFDSVADPLKFPDNIHLGEVAGVATNSKGDIFVYTRTGHPTITIGTSRAFAHGGSRLFRVRPKWEIRSRNRARDCMVFSLRSRCASIRRTTSGSLIKCRAW